MTQRTTWPAKRQCGVEDLTIFEGEKPTNEQQMNSETITPGYLLPPILPFEKVLAGGRVRNDEGFGDHAEDRWPVLIDDARLTLFVHEV